MSLRTRRAGVLRPWNGGPHGCCCRGMGDCGRKISERCMMGRYFGSCGIGESKATAQAKATVGGIGPTPCGTMALGRAGRLIITGTGAQKNNVNCRRHRRWYRRSSCLLLNSVVMTLVQKDGIEILAWFKITAAGWMHSEPIAMCS